MLAGWLTIRGPRTDLAASAVDPVQGLASRCCLPVGAVARPFLHIGPQMIPIYGWHSAGADLLERWGRISKIVLGPIKYESERGC